MRWLLMVSLVVLGCGKGGGAAATPAERAAACVDYQLSYWRGVAEATGTPPQPDIDRYACADLYSRSSCPAAWKGEEGRAANLATACAAAYCDALEGKPALCRRGPDTLEPNDLVHALVELDGAILALELGDPALGRQIAARLRLMLSRTDATR